MKIYQDANVIYVPTIPPRPKEPEKPKREATPPLPSNADMAKIGKKLFKKSLSKEIGLPHIEETLQPSTEAALRPTDERNLLYLIGLVEDVSASVDQIKEFLFGSRTGNSKPQPIGDENV